MDDGIDFAELERDHVRSRLYPGFAWWEHDAFSPRNPLPVPLAAARVGFVTTAGTHLPDQEPFDAGSDAGDPSFRAFPAETPLAEVALTHGGYDTRPAGADTNVVLPLDHLRGLTAEGRIGGLAATVCTFMGYVANADPLVRESGPEVAGRLVAEGADLELLAPT